MDAAIKHGFVTKRGSWLSFGDDQLGQGHNGARKNMQQNPELTERMIKLINEKIEPSPEEEVSSTVKDDSDEEVKDA